MASEILNNLQLGTLILNASRSISLTTTSGAILSSTPVTITDNGTAANGTLGQFNAHYLAAPTLAATNTGVTTTSANTLTVAGAPISGTNQTLTNAYALNVMSGATYLAGTATVGGLLTTTSLKNSGLLVPKVQAGTSNLSSGAQTITFGTAFSSAPAITITPNASLGTQQMSCFFITASSATNFNVKMNYISQNQSTPTGAGGSDASSWIAVGA